MKVFIKGKKTPIILDKNDFVTQGGEASIYIHKNTVFKIYTDPTNVISESKVRELSVLNRLEIVRPVDTILDSKDKNIGFTMNFIPDTIPLCKLFTTDFWTRNRITTNFISKIIEKIVDVTSFIHGNHGFLIVDGNEFNYLIGSGSVPFEIPYFIDVNSYQTPSFPATAIMPTVRDFHTKGFDHGSDWFSFAIVAFQLFSGIHPYKGKHPDFGKGDLEGRMKANVSVFHKDVTCPGPTRDFKSIPNNYLDWFMSVFENGIRTLPPNKAGEAIKVQPGVQVLGNIDAFEWKETFKANGDILYYAINGSTEIMKISDGTVSINKKSFILPNPSAEIVFSPKTVTPFFVYIDRNRLKIINSILGIDIIGNNFYAESMMVIDNKIYIHSIEKFIEISIQEFIPGKCIANVTISMNVLPLATTIFSGVAHMNVLGIHYMIIPRPGNGSEISRMEMIKIEELFGHQILDAKRIKNVLVIISRKGSIFYESILKFNEDFKQKNIETRKDIIYAGINYTVLDHNVLILMHTDGILDVVSSMPTLKHPRIFTGMDQNIKLYSSGTRAVFTKGKSLYSFSMKK